MNLPGLPVINIQPSRTVYAITGQRVTLKCSAEGDPTPTVYWIEPSRPCCGDTPVESSIVIDG